MVNQEIFDELEQKSREDDLFGFFQLALPYIQKYVVYPGLQDEIETILSNYHLMLQCYKQGMKDERRPHIFVEMLRFERKVFNNLKMNEAILSYSHLSAAKKRADKVDLLQVREMVEATHHGDDLELYNNVFSALLVSWQWDKKLQDYYTSFILDSSTDKKLSALMISALMLSCLCVFDLCKFKTLVDIYLKETDPLLKERALVGWAFASCNFNHSNDTEVENILLAVLHQKEVLAELVELQKQVVFCLSAEKDSQTVDNDIISNVPLNDYRDLIKDDSTDSSLNEILHPEQEEEKAEKLEQSVLNMMKMEKAGSDIYFGGFSKMKNFAFFHRLSNWFIPYFAENPQLSPILQSLDGDAKLLKSIENDSPFCESDKYSFSFAVDLSLHASLAPIKSFLKEGTLFGNGMQLRKDVDHYSLARRMYLQDLLRFFKVSSFKGGFSNPFSGEENSVGYFLGNWNFSKLEDMQDYQIAKFKICKFLMKRKAYSNLLHFFPSGRLENAEMEKEVMFLRGVYEMYGTGNLMKAVLVLGMVEMTNRESVKVSKALAKCLLKAEMYNEAKVQYEKLSKLAPSPEIQYMLAFCMLHVDEVDDAMRILFELNYKQPDNLYVIRSIAWGHLLQHNTDKALEMYGKLKEKLESSGQTMSAEDYYNLGLCHWVNRDVEQACQYFRLYIDKDGMKDGQSFVKKIKEDDNILTKHGLGFQDLLMIRDILFNANK